MNSSEVKKILNSYADLKKQAEKVLIAGDIEFEDVSSIILEDDEVGINYCRNRYGYIFNEYEHVPIEFFAGGIDLEAEWQKIRETRKKKRKREEAAARRAEAREKKKMELAELKRLKKKYPDA